MFRIPKTIQLFGHTISTYFDKKLTTKAKRSGEADFIAKKITLQPPTKNFPLDKEYIGQTYCHELVHWLFYLSGYEKDAMNEKKVDLIASLLHQALNSAEYDPNIDQIIENGIDNCLLNSPKNKTNIDLTKK